MKIHIQTKILLLCGLCVCITLGIPSNNQNKEKNVKEWKNTMIL